MLTKETSLRLLDLTPLDVPVLLRDMRVVDRFEAAVMSARDCGDAVRATIQRTPNPRAAYWNGELVACYGFAYDTMGRTSVPWLLATHALERREVGAAVARASSREFQALKPEGTYFRNYVFDGNHVAVRWLTHLGFVPAEQIELRGHPFTSYIMEHTPCA